VVAGFVGVLVILSPNIGAHAAGGSDNLQTGAILAFVAALCMGAAMTMVRMLTGTERTAAIVIYMAIVGTVFSLATLPFGWVVPSATDAALLVLIGLVGGVGQILMTQSYRYADASTIAPFDYTSMIWALLIGWLAFGEVPGIPVYVGSAILVSAGLFVIYREHRLGLDRTQARRASMPTRV